MPSMTPSSVLLLELTAMPLIVACALRGRLGQRHLAPAPAGS